MKILKYQFWHLLLLLILVYGLYIWICLEPLIFKGQLFGAGTEFWFILAVLAPIIHQIYVLICWRYELFYQGISRNFGVNGFKYYKIGFAVLILSRPVSIVLLAISNAQTLALNHTFLYILAAIIAVPAIYLFYSVKMYFGMDRAFGLDHFQPAAFRNEPFVRKGIFKYTSNGMYIYGFLLLWIPGLLWQSKAALLIALFNHIYIWVHYYFTELPDIKFIYGDRDLE
ncbi:MAG: hypothetical protein KJN76_10905 [Eudoraea sp.]|nr:hypothetical protein [Eudoraea sp.]